MDYLYQASPDKPFAATFDLVDLLGRKSDIDFSEALQIANDYNRGKYHPDTIVKIYQDDRELTGVLSGSVITGFGYVL